MEFIPDFIFYALMFLSVYAQVFFLVTFLENRKKIIVRKEKIKLKDYPAVTIAVPCWNEEKTVDNTINSIFNFNYPKDKLHVFIVDDGSTDNTWKVIQKYEKYPNIKIFHKKNGGKHTALNLALENLETNFFACLGADSFADPESLMRIMSYFEKDQTIMAVAPSVIVHNPKTIIQTAQKVEYHLILFLKKLLGILGGIHVTPGPLSVFRRKVFDDLGPYRFAHNAEDMEIAYRMQKHHYKIEQCNDALVFTNAPSTLKGLSKQRLRWIYGSINNAIDYRHLMFNYKYGNFSFFTLPLILTSIFAALYLIIRTFYKVFDFIFAKIIEYSTIGFNLPGKEIFQDSFFINIQPVLFIGVFLLLSTIFAITYGRKMVEHKWRFSFDIFYYLIITAVIGPFWFLKAFFNTVLRNSPSWR